MTMALDVGGVVNPPSLYKWFYVFITFFLEGGGGGYFSYVFLEKVLIYECDPVALPTDWRTKKIYNNYFSHEYENVNYSLASRS